MAKKFRDFKSAREFAKSLKLKGVEEWREYCKSGNKPDDIPRNPDTTYKNKGWIGMGDWLGTGRVANFNKQFRDFESAREFARNLKLKTSREWNEYCKSGNKPEDIPSAPNQIYKNKGWIGWGDFFRTGKVANYNKKFRDFESAREFVRSLGFERQSDWFEFCRLGKKPKDIPYSPNEVYKDKGWKGYGDWIGTGKLSSKEISENFLSFKEARDEVRKLAKKYKLKNWDDWRRATSEGKIPKNIPFRPDHVYSKKKKRD